eukprot:c4631_g1_i1.p1 GENE.c4631_g1_i1~~c4631_g1_i1.p1  ORF type:complete len:636 (-),score=107.27 c4631_g1_i1:102-2009(-)
MGCEFLSCGMLSVFSLLALSHECKHAEVFSKADLIVEPQEYIDASSSKALGLDFEVVFDNSHCTYAGQVIQRIVSCSQTESYVCRQEDVLTSEKKNFLQNQVLSRATSFWTNTLDTDTSSVSVSKGKCCAIDISTPRSSSAKYLLFVTFHPTVGDTLAWAGACRVDQTGRPFAGQANFGPNHVDVQKEQKAFLTAVHELAHALGFTSSLFDGYKKKDSRGQLVSHSQVSKTVTERGHSITKVVTPNVVKFVSDHFNCPHMTNPGAEMEDGGGSGTVGSHWEKRIFHNELMVGATSGDSIISPLTLALFADMGWYRVSNTHRAIGSLTWGKGEGCSFVQDRCSSWPKKYFCSATNCKAGYKSCSFDRRSKAYCNLASWSGSLPTYYQYFSDPTKGGNDELADYCPYNEAYANGDCTDTSQPNKEIHSDIRARESLCFESTVIQTAQPAFSEDDCGQRPTTLCHRRQCLNDGTSRAQLRVYLGTGNTHYVDCPSNGGNVNVYEKLSSRNQNCKDDTKWETGYARPANCRDFEGKCLNYKDMGQFQKCPVTCRSCAAYDGVITCPPVNEVCSTGSSPSSSIFALFVGLGVGASVIGIFAFVACRRSGGLLGRKKVAAPELSSPMLEPEPNVVESSATQ